MIVQLPLEYQPPVGQTVTVPVTGKVIAVRIDPLAPAGKQVIAEIDTGEGVEFPVAGERRSWDIPVQTGVGGGNT